MKIFACSILLMVVLEEVYCTTVTSNNTRSSWRYDYVFDNDKVINIEKDNNTGKYKIVPVSNSTSSGLKKRHESSSTYEHFTSKDPVRYGGDSKYNVPTSSKVSSSGPMSQDPVTPGQKSNTGEPVSSDSIPNRPRYQTISTQYSSDGVFLQGPTESIFRPFNGPLYHHTYPPMTAQYIYPPYGPGNGLMYGPGNVPMYGLGYRPMYGPGYGPMYGPGNGLMQGPGNIPMQGSGNGPMQGPSNNVLMQGPKVHTPEETLTNRKVSHPI